ncbi:MAG: hypothetical protein PVJ52_02065 [Candidatus Woesebacteria bacterium]|jgi:hypothetical protein
MPEEAKSLPFSIQSGKEIGKGAVSRVWEHNGDQVIKEVTQKGKVNTEETLKQNQNDYKFLKKRLGNYIPETHFVRGPNSKGEATNFIVQKKVEGTPLNQLNDNKLSDPEIKSTLNKLLKRTLDMWNETGRLPDLLGNTKAVLLGPRYTPNIMIDNETKECYLTDTDANPDIFSNKAPLIYKLRTYLSAWNLKRYIQKLQ